MATIATASMNGPVRIRNLSPSGALIEADELPQTGDSVRLRRGTLSVAGKVVRRDGRQAGLRFDRATSVESWLSAGNSKQRAVDRVFQAAKHRYPVADLQHLSEDTDGEQSTLKQELGDVADRLDQLANALSDETEIIAKYMQQLQVLDIAAQKLRGLA